MTRMSRTLVPAVAALLACAGAAPAWWHGYGVRTAAYYAPAYVGWAMPAYVGCWNPAPLYAAPEMVSVAPEAVYGGPEAVYVPGAVAPAGPGLATPRAAPPSSEPAAPSTPTKKGPAVSESRTSFYGPDLAEAGAARPAAERLPVSFLNLSGRELNLTVDGRAYTLSGGKTLRLGLGRSFVWRVGDREPENERIPDRETGLEIVFRP